MSDVVVTGDRAQSMLDGLPIKWPASTIVPDMGAAEGVGALVDAFPVVVKAEGLAHRHSSGGVWTGISRREDLEAAVRAFGLHFGFPVTVAPQIDHEDEYILGATRNPVSGECLAMIGRGGTEVEATEQVSYLLMPISRHEAERCVGRLVSDEEHAVHLTDALEALERTMLGDVDSIIGEIDLNPVVFAAHSGALYALDAKIFLRG
jgi:succinyl-CoA synthetase beta subunit